MSNILGTTSPVRTDKTPQVTVTSSNGEFETLIRTTSLPLPDSEAVENDFRTSAPVPSHPRLNFARSLPADAKNDRRMRTRRTDGVSGHESLDGGNQSTCVFDNRMYSPGGSTSSRCSDDEDDDETLASPCGQQSPVSPELTCEKYVVTIS